MYLSAASILSILSRTQVSLPKHTLSLTVGPVLHRVCLFCININLYNCSCNCICCSCICIVIVCSVSLIVCVVLCAVFCLRVICYFVRCVLCLIVVPLPPDKTPFAVKINK
jgi:hypothetical protein